MSADNWAVCPKCVQNAKQSLENAKKNAKNAYGNVGADEYELMLVFIKQKESEKMPTELREDYYQGVDEDGEYSVRYSCTCYGCGFHYKYSHAEETWDMSKKR